MCVEVSTGASNPTYFLQPRSLSHDFSCHQPQTPTPPSINPTMSMPRRMKAIQRYLSSFEYNFTGQTFVSLRRDKGMKHLVFSAKTLMRECLPIQCVEALFIGVFLTNGIEEVSCRHQTFFLFPLFSILDQHFISFYVYQSVLKAYLMELNISTLFWVLNIKIYGALSVFHACQT